MAVITGNGVIEGVIGRPIAVGSAPVAGTDEIQTLTIGGTPTGGTFTLTFYGMTTAPISWSATNATLVANIDAALEALPVVGTGGVTTAVGTAVAGIGTITVTFTGTDVGRKAVPTMTADGTLLTGTSPTVAVAETTPGVDATYRGASTGSMLVSTATGVVYVNTSTTAGAPVWAVVGGQS